MKYQYLFCITILLFSCKTDQEKLFEAISSKDYEKVEKYASIPFPEDIPLSETPLFSCYELKDLKTMETLLKNGFSPEYQTNRSKTLLEIAYEEKRIDEVELLLKYGADYHFSIRRSSDYLPFIFFLILDKHYYLLDYVLDDADYSFRDDKGNTLLHVAAEYGLSSKYFLKILENYDDVNLTNKRGETPFLVGCRSDNINNLNLLLNNGANANQPSDYNDPWGIAVRKIYKDKDYSLAEFLAQNGPNINVIRSHVGTTPLSEACEIKNLEIAKFMLDNGADPNVLDDRGNKAIQYLGGPFDYTQEERDSFDELFARYEKLQLFNKDTSYTYVNQYKFGPMRNVGIDFLKQLNKAEVITDFKPDLMGYSLIEEPLPLNEDEKKTYQKFVGFYERKEAYTYENLFNNFYSIQSYEASWGSGYNYFGRKPYQVYFSMDTKDFDVDEINSGGRLSEESYFLEHYVKTCGPGISDPLYLRVIADKEVSINQSWDKFNHQYSKDQLGAVKAFFSSILTDNFKDLDLLISPEYGYLFDPQIESGSASDFIAIDDFQRDLYQHGTALMDHLDSLQSSLSESGFSYDFRILYNCFYGEDISVIENIFGTDVSLFEFVFPDNNYYLSMILVTEENSYKVAYFNDSFFLP